MATIKDVATLAGVGVGTVSRYMSGGSVSQKRGLLIEAAMQQLQYRPNSFARSLSKRQSGLIGVWLPSLSGPFYHTILTAIEAQLRNHDKHLILANAQDAIGDEQQLSHLEYLFDRDCDGVLMACPSMSDENLQSLMLKHPNLILINRKLKTQSSNCFAVDHYQGGQLAADKLFALGHRNFAVVAGRLSAQDAQLRQQGFVDRLNELGASIESDLIIEGSFDYQQGAIAIARLIEQRSRFSALFCANDKLAQVALSQAYQLGLKIPEQLAVLGYDDVDFCPFTAPPLSTVHIPIEQMATAACRKVLNLAYALDLSLEHEFEPLFTQRSST